MEAANTLLGYTAIDGLLDDAAGSYKNVECRIIDFSTRKLLNCRVDYDD